MLGETVGSYKIIEQIGEGGMGAVYRGEHIKLGRTAAIKVLLREFSSSANIVTRFFNEAKAATAIKHPGIVEVFDFGNHTDGSPFIVMELLRGEPLHTRIYREKKLPVAVAVSIMSQIASALGAAHAEGIIHRDLKPDNVFLVPDDLIEIGVRVKLLDFGIAKLDEELRGGLEATRAGAVLGTPQYMAPEQCMGSTEVDHRADMYALGCLLFHILCGRPPFTEEEFGKLAIQHLRDAPPNPSELEPSIKPALEKTILRLLEKEPVDRFQSCGQLIAALEGREPRAATPVPKLAKPKAAAPDAPTKIEGIDGSDAPSAPSAPSGSAPKKRKTAVMGVEDSVQSGNESSGTDKQAAKDPAKDAAQRADVAPADDDAGSTHSIRSSSNNMLLLAVTVAVAIATAAFLLLR